MTDILVSTIRVTSQQGIVDMLDRAAYSVVGLREVVLTELHPRLLSITCDLLDPSVPAACLHFWQHAVPHCSLWLAHHIQQELPQPGGRPSPVAYVVALGKPFIT